jgi:hypothetical protein
MTQMVPAHSKGVQTQTLVSNPLPTQNTEEGSSLLDQVIAGTLSPVISRMLNDDTRGWTLADEALGYEVDALHRIGWHAEGKFTRGISLARNIARRLMNAQQDSKITREALEDDYADSANRTMTYSEYREIRQELYDRHLDIQRQISNLQRRYPALFRRIPCRCGSLNGCTSRWEVAG